MIRSHPRLAWLAAGLFALAALFCVPLGLEAESLLVGGRRSGGDRRPRPGARVRPHRRASTRSRRRSTPTTPISPRALSIWPTIAAWPCRRSSGSESTAAVDDANSASAAADSFASGLITGEPKDMVGLAGTALGDLFVFGDIRDAVREGSRYVSGESYDQLMLGLSVCRHRHHRRHLCDDRRGDAGAGRAFRGEGGAQDRPDRARGWPTGSAARCARSSTGRRSSAPAPRVAEPAVAVRAAREAVKVEKADGLVRLVSDVGRVQTKAGTQAALDGLKLAEGPREMSRIATLAEKKGSKTRAILKTLGRGAILLSIASFNLAAWVLGAILTLFGFVSSAKAAVERATFRHLARKKERQATRYAMMAQSRA